MKTIKSHIYTVSLTMFQYYTLPTPYTLSVFLTLQILQSSNFTLFQSYTLPIILSKIQN